MLSIENPYTRNMKYVIKVLHWQIACPDYTRSMTKPFEIFQPDKIVILHKKTEEKIELYYLKIWN